jgi:diguanylate cyclase (GGDEF)-like protein
VRVRQSPFLQSVPDAFLLVGHDGVVQEHLGGGCNDPILRPEQMPGHALEALWPADAAAQARVAIRRVLATRASERLEVALEREGATQTCEARFFVQGRRQVLLILRNVTEERRRDASVRRAALYDAATGLPGRELFLEHLARALTDARLKERGLAIVFVCLDTVAGVSEACGRAVADLLVQEISHRLARSLRESDRVLRLGDERDPQCVAALGGDTFGIVLADVRMREEARAIARRLRSALGEPVRVQGRELSVDLSIGICLYPSDGGDVEALLRHASAALAEARHAGRGEAEFYSDTMRLRSVSRIDMASELRFALDHGQLELHYQPRGDARTLEPAGLEALLRWPHPLRGQVPLEELIPLAAATGLELPISEWVLRTACAQVQAWRAQGLEPPRLTVNLSHQQFSLDDLPERIAAALAGCGLPGSALELDLTERMLLRARAGARGLERCRDLGLRIMLDHFGTGYSSLGHLGRLPIDGLKIDRSFVGRLDGDPGCRAACAGILALARELGLGTVAEGVESQAQLDYLRSRGCDHVQGFHYCPPLAPAAMTAWLRARRAAPARRA